MDEFTKPYPMPTTRSGDIFGGIITPMMAAAIRKRRMGGSIYDSFPELQPSLSGASDLTSLPNTDPISYSGYTPHLPPVPIQNAGGDYQPPPPPVPINDVTPMPKPSFAAEPTDRPTFSRRPLMRGIEKRGFNPPQQEPPQQENNPYRRRRRRFQTA